MVVQKLQLKLMLKCSLESQPCNPGGGAVSSGYYQSDRVCLQNRVINMDKNNQHFTISQLSSLLNITKSTLRFWEKEFPMILVPLRTKGGQRRYMSEHIAIVKEINALKRTGLSLTDIKRELANGPMTETEYQRSGNAHIDRVDLLAERVAEAVKLEVLRFFKQD